MRLYYYTAPEGNLGDDLNEWLWPKEIPSLAESRIANWLVGIGTILDERLLEVEGSKCILGTGYRPGTWEPRVQPDWDIRFVRGPLTAKAYGIDSRLALGDPALLVADYCARAASTSNRVGFIPHFLTSERIDCQHAAEAAGMTLIDPRWGVARCLELLASMDRVVTEAMHGAILADSLGIPWLRAKVLAFRIEAKGVAEFKWADWAQTLGMEPAPSVAVWIPYRLGRRWARARPVMSYVSSKVLANSLRAAKKSGQFQLSDAGRRKELRERMRETFNALTLRA